MSITPPPSYPLHQAQPPAHLTQQDLKQPLDTVAKDLNKGLDQKEEARPDKPNNGLVNVFVSLLHCLLGYLTPRTID